MIPFPMSRLSRVCFRQTNIQTPKSALNIGVFSWKKNPIYGSFSRIYRTIINTAILVYKCLHGSAPVYLTDELCQMADVEARQRLRSSLSSSLIVSRTRLPPVGDGAFPVAAARAWNSLPDFVTSAPSVAVFQSRLKTHLFNISYPLWLYSACAVIVALDTIIVLACLLTYLPRSIMRISPHHSHLLHSHHLSLPQPFTPDLKLVSFTNPFLHSHSYSFRTDFTDLEPVRN